MAEPGALAPRAPQASSARADARRAIPGSQWLEADGLGGYASGTALGIRDRRYHGVLLVAATPPTSRTMLVNAVEAWVVTPRGAVALSSHRYRSDVVHPDGCDRLSSFTSDPWPRWTWDLGGGLTVEHELLLVHGLPLAVLVWRAHGPREGVHLRLRPLLSGRGMHALHRENASFAFEPERSGACLRWRPYPGLPAIVASASGSYAHEPLWYRSFQYDAERERGLDHEEDLASPGTFELDLARDAGVLLLAAEAPALPAVRDLLERPPLEAARELIRAESVRRERLGDRLDRAADRYLVRRGAGRSIIAGYPWFADWGRDTFIALRGLCLATGRLDDAVSILEQWAGAVSEGMLPNRFVEEGEAPELNSVDAALWFVVVVGELLDELEHRTQAALRNAVEAILAGYERGTRYRIRCDADGLLAAGEPGWQLTWMDARAHGREVTPRIGKPVEVQALWINALAVGERFDPHWGELRERATRAFGERFWNTERGCLFDVVDVDHVPGTADASLRPNQVLAVGGLPVALLAGERARRVVDVCEASLWTPLGLRSLAPDDPRYVARYRGGPDERDAAYHQGTAWAWLLGPFVEAWLRARGGTDEARREARERFLAPLRAHLDEAGLDHVSEIADGDPPHAPRGAPFQAWSLGELLRLERRVLADTPLTVSRRRRAAGAPG